MQSFKIGCVWLCVAVRMVGAEEDATEFVTGFQSALCTSAGNASRYKNERYIVEVAL